MTCHMASPRMGVHKATTNCIVVSRPGYVYNSVRAGGRAGIFIIHYGCGKGNTSHKVL